MENVITFICVSARLVIEDQPECPMEYEFRSTRYSLIGEFRIVESPGKYEVGKMYNVKISST